MTEPKDQAAPVVGATVAEQAIRHLSRLVRVYGDMQDGNGNTPTEIRHAERFLSEVNTAVPVVGVEEAVERLTRTLANKDQRDKRQPDHQFAGLATVDTDDLRTILQALQGSSLRDPHRATEQTVVGVEEAVERLEKYLFERAKSRQLDPVDIHSMHVGDEREAVLTTKDLRTILQALQGSSFASAQDTDRATEQPVVDEEVVLRAAISDAIKPETEGLQAALDVHDPQGRKRLTEWAEAIIRAYGRARPEPVLPETSMAVAHLSDLLSAEHLSGDDPIAGMGSVSWDDLRIILTALSQAENSHHKALQAQLKAAYEALEGLVNVCLASDFNDRWDEYEAARQALARRRED